jgi:lipopolysaccharide/colanic/teichoic acid biosynthesis glycosyltransferase
MSYGKKYYTDINKILNFLPDMKKSSFFNFLFRTRDVLIALIGLIILSPLFLFIAIWIKLDSPGPILFKGPRVGKNGKVFQILKFRTMYENPTSYQGPKITSENDPRITKVGSWLRNSKLNELPQLWNVLIGEMSLVGPRPEDPDIAQNWLEELRTEIFSIRPGITSPASVLFRDEESMLSTDAFMETYLGSIQPNKLRLDQLYVRYRSLWVDMDVLLWTFLILLPKLSQSKPAERVLYGGVVSRLARYITSWFFIDFLIALSAVSTSVLFWRAFGPFDLGFWNVVLEAVEFSIVFSFVGALFGIQKIHWSKAAPSDIINLFVSSFFSAVILVLVNALRHRLPPEVIITGAIATFLGMVLVRYRYRLFTGFAGRWLWFRKDRDVYRERVLIIGSGDAGSYAAWLLSNSKDGLKYNVIGYLDDDFHKQGIRYRGIEVLGSTEDLENTIEKYDVGLILFAIHKIEEKKRAKILERCKATEANVVVFPNIIGEITEAVSGNTHARESNGQQSVPTTGKTEHLSTSQKEKILAVLEELKIHMNQSEIDKCYENIGHLYDLVTQTEEEDVHE